MARSLIKEADSGWEIVERITELEYREWSRTEAPRIRFDFPLQHNWSSLVRVSINRKLRDTIFCSWIWINGVCPVFCLFSSLSLPCFRLIDWLTLTDRWLSTPPAPPQPPTTTTTHRLAGCPLNCDVCCSFSEHRPTIMVDVAFGSGQQRKRSNELQLGHEIGCCAAPRLLTPTTNNKLPPDGPQSRNRFRAPHRTLCVTLAGDSFVQRMVRDLSSIF